jgi:hypothetical protein
MIKVHVSHYINICIEKWLFDNFTKDEYQKAVRGYFVEIYFKSELSESFFILKFGNLEKRGIYSADDVVKFLLKTKKIINQL